MLSATSADCVGVLEHPENVPTANIVSNAPDSMFDLMFSPFLATRLDWSRKNALWRLVESSSGANGKGFSRSQSQSSNDREIHELCLFTNALNSLCAGENAANCYFLTYNNPVRVD